MGCSSALENALVVSRRGGLPTNPEGWVIGDRPWVDLRDLWAFRGENTSSLPQENPPTKLVEANGWIVHPDGTIELVAMVNHSQPQALPFDCAARSLIPNPVKN